MYEYAGGEAAFLALARAHHERCVADPMLNHPFSKEDMNPLHVERLAGYWAEVLGGPPRFSEQLSDHSSMLRMHAGNGPGMLELGPRFVECFVAAADDVGLPDDPAFRAALRAYMEWAVADVNEFFEPDATVPAGFRMPRWDWDGLVTSGRD
nr:group II truncated hemoglobin [Pedococcus badiiscoriae]